MQSRTNTRLITLGVFYNFAIHGGLAGTVINTGVFVIPGSMHIMAAVNELILIDGNPGAKLQLGYGALPGAFGTIAMGSGNVLLQPQPEFVSTPQEIILTIDTDNITQGDANITFLFVKAIR